MSGRSTDIIFLLGAGASVEAGIPASAKMIDEIEVLLRTDDGWAEFQDLYNHVKSAIHYSSGLKGDFGTDVPFNVETLVNTLYELERNEEHPLYPFIAAWNSRFVSLANPDFSTVRRFRTKILEALKKWMCPEDTAQGDYYHGFRTLQQDFNYPLHLFSLNYDLCVERIADSDFRVESGFSGFGPNHVWDWERFEQAEGSPPDLPQIYLYKLHGSINWKRDDGKNLFSVEQTETVEPNKMDVIFGRDFKLEAADPYLFYAYQFRRFALEARLIVTIGYSFADEHINKMLSQSIKREEQRKVLVISNCSDGDVQDKRNDTAGILECSEDRVEVVPGTAKSLLQEVSLSETLLELVPQPEDAGF